MSKLSELWAEAVSAWATSNTFEEIALEDHESYTYNVITKFDKRLKDDVIVPAWGYAPGPNGKVRIAGGCSTVCAPLRQALTTVLLRPAIGEYYICKTWVAKNYEKEGATDDDLDIAASAPQCAELQALERFIDGVPGPTLATLVTELVQSGEIWVAPKYQEGWDRFLAAIGFAPAPAEA